MPKIRIVDFETSGMEPPAAQVVELGYCDVAQEDGLWKIGARASALYEVDHLPPEVRAVHHISMAELAGAPRFDPVQFWDFLRQDGIDVVATHNLDFDGKFWGEAQLPAFCTLKAALRVWPQAPGHSNAVLRYWLQDEGLIPPPVPEWCLPPHRAGPDAYVTALIVLALLKATTANEMIGWAKEPRVLPTCPIGEWRGKPWPAVDAGFLRWMMNKPVEPDLVWNAQRELNRRRSA